MTYKSRIPAGSDYLHSVGRAFYNFTYLEWVVISTIVKLSADGFGSVPRGKAASHIAKALIKAVAATEPPLPDKLRRDLVKFHESYLAAISRRNKLLHAHPYTAPNGDQQLSGGGIEWPTDIVVEAAKFFEETAITGNKIFHGELKVVRP
ncbi:MAG: hypothetical protein KA296_15830 [Marinobacter sp.]|nr:hypothetical protein [Marinobacter sp.]